jgi:3-oxoacyl-[acyl-carrier protein] reductase
METHAFGFRLRANAPEGRKRFPISPISRKVTVNATALGMVATDMSSMLDENYRAKIIEQIPLGRFAEVGEIARMGLFLLSDDARYITGQVIQVDGGLAM